MRLPVDEFAFRVAQRLGRRRRVLLQRGELRFAFAHGAAQRFDLRVIGADMFVEFRQRLIGFGAIAFETLAQFAIVLNLLFDARDFAADAINLALHLVEIFAGQLMFLAMAFDLRFDLALFGDQTFDPDLALTQRGRVFAEFGGDHAVMQRAQFRFAAAVLGFEILPARGGLGLTVQMFELFFRLPRARR